MICSKTILTNKINLILMGNLANITKTNRSLNLNSYGMQAKVVISVTIMTISIWLISSNLHYTENSLSGFNNILNKGNLSN